MNDKNKLLQQRNDLMQTRADHLEVATKAYTDGDMTGYNAAMEKVKDCNAKLETIAGLIAECDKSFGPQVPNFDLSDTRTGGAEKSLLDSIRGTEKYAKAWLEVMRKGITLDKGRGMETLSPLYEAENAAKALTIGGGDTAGEDGGFLVPLDFDLRVNQLQKEYIDLSNLVTVERVNVIAGWRVIDSTGTLTPLTAVEEMGKINPGQQPKFNKISYSCKKYADKLIVSNELMADAQGLMEYLAGWWTPKFVLTKNALILDKLGALPFAPLAGATDAEQIKALKTLINTGLNTAHRKRATILTNAFGYDAMDNWADTSGRPMLVPDPKGGDFVRFKGRPVEFADADLIPAVTEGGTNYNPIYVGDFKSFCRLFLRNGIRIRSTDIGGDAWDTDSNEIRCTCRMDCQTVDETAVKRTGIQAAE